MFHDPQRAMVSKVKVEFLSFNHRVRRFECLANTQRRNFQSLCASDRSIIRGTRSLDELWLDGPVSQFICTFYYEHDIGQVFLIEEEHPAESIAPFAVEYSGMDVYPHTGIYVMPKALAQEKHIQEMLYNQMRTAHHMTVMASRNSRKNDVLDEALYLPPLAHVSYECRVVDEAITLQYTPLFLKKEFHPYMPPGSPTYAVLFDLPLAMRRAVADVCPTCLSCYAAGGHCNGGFRLYYKPEGVVREEVDPCPYITNAPRAPTHDPSHMTTTLEKEVDLQEPQTDATLDKKDGEYTDGFDDRGRLSSVVGTGTRPNCYNSHNHFQTSMTSFMGTQKTSITPEIVRDVREFLWLRNIHATRQEVRRALTVLESYERGRYEPFYQDAQRIAATIHGEPGKPPDNAIPPYYQGKMRDYFKAAYRAFLDCPSEIKGVRGNFMRNDFNIWVLAGVCASMEDDPEFLKIRDHVNRSDGTPPRLKDPLRHNQYIKIWNWILQQCGWNAAIHTITEF